jgi:tetratricopeptide (TPR) repeat protein
VKHALGTDAETAQQLCGLLAWPWIVMHLYEEGLTATRRALALRPTRSETRAAALLGEAILALRRGEIESVTRASTAALELDPPPLVRCGALMNLSYLAVLGSDPVRASELAEEALATARGSSDPWHEAWAHSSVSFAAWCSGDMKLAYRTSVESIDLHQAVGDLRSVAGTQSNHAELLIDLGRIDEAEPYLEAALASARELDDSHLALFPLLNSLALQLLRRRRDHARRAAARVCPARRGAWGCPRRARLLAGRRRRTCTRRCGRGGSGALECVLARPRRGRAVRVHAQSADVRARAAA